MANSNDSLKQIKILNKAANLDVRYGPWTSLAEANANIPLEVREKGLTIAVDDANNGLDEYWYKDGVTDNDLILKISHSVTANTSDLTNDGEDGINPFITAQNLPTYNLDVIEGEPYKFSLTLNGTQTGNIIDLEPYLDNTDKFPTDISLNNETGLVTITFNDASVITEDFSSLLGSSGRIIVDTLDDAKALQLNDGEFVEIKAHASAGYPLFRELEYNRYDSMFENPFEIHPDLASLPKVENVYYITKDSSLVYTWDGTTHNPLAVVTLADYDVDVFGELVENDTTRDDNKLLIDSVNNKVFYVDSVIGRTVELVGVTPTILVTLPREGFERSYYYLKGTQTLYKWNINTLQYEALSTPQWIPRVNVNQGDFRKFTVNEHEEIFEVLHTHLTALTLEPNKSNYGKVNIWEVTVDAATRGSWIDTEDYIKDDVVSHNGINYKAKQNHFSKLILPPDVAVSKLEELIKKGYGAGLYVFDKTPITTVITGNTINGLESTVSRNNGITLDYELAPISQSLPTHIGYGTNLISESGEIIGLRLGRQPTDDNEVAMVPKGTTNLTTDGLRNGRLYFRNRYEADFDHGDEGGRIGLIEVGEELFICDNDGTVVRPNYTGFDGKGVLKLVTRKNEKVTPENFGAIPDSPYNYTNSEGIINYTTDERPFDSRSHIQKAKDDLFNPYYKPVGEFYISEELYVRRNKPYVYEGNDVPINFARSGRIRRLAQANTGYLWSDRDINYIVMREVDPLPKSNFNINAQFVEYTTGAAILCDGRYRQRLEDVRLERKGNYHTLMGTADNGIRGIVLEPRPDYWQDSESSYGTRFGVNYDSKYTISGDYAYSNFERRADIKGISYFTNGADLTILNADFIKTSVVDNRGYGNLNIYQNTMQARKLLTLTQREELPTFKLSSSAKLNSYPMDFKITQGGEFKYYKNLYEIEDTTFFAETPFIDNTDLENSFVNEEYETVIGNDTYRAIKAYYARWFVEPIGDGVVLGWLTLKELKRRKNIFKNYQKLKQYKEDVSELIIPKNSFPRTRLGIRDSAKENQLLYRNKAGRDAFYFNPYSIADRETLKTLEEKSEGAAGVSVGNINITNPDGCLEHTALSTTIGFDVDSDFNNDYAEMYIENITGNFSPSPSLYIDLFNTLEFYPKALQLIVLDSTTNLALYNETLELNKIKGNKYFEFEGVSQNSQAKTLIIRFIGLETTFDSLVIEDEAVVEETAGEGSTGSYYVNDIISFGLARSNYVTIGGGQTMLGDLLYTHGKSPFLKSPDGSTVKFVPINTVGAAAIAPIPTKRIALVRNDGDVASAANPLISPYVITSDDIGRSTSNAIDMVIWLRDVIRGFSGKDNETLSNLTFKPSILGSNQNDLNFPVDAFFAPTNIEPKGITISNSNNGFVLYSSRDDGGSIAIRKFDNASFSGARQWFYLWDSQHFTKAQYDRFNFESYTDVDKNNGSVNTLVDTDGSQRITIDASAGAVTLTLPAINVNNVGLKYKLIAYDATNVITINTNGTEEIRRTINNVSTSDTLVEGDILEIVQKNTYWQVT